MTERRDVVVLCGALLVVRVLSAIVVAQPGYTDAYYYVNVAERLARGDGLTADFVWNFLEAPGLAAMPIASHRFWMPLATVLQASGIALLGGALGAFRAAQLATVLVAAFIPLVAYLAARSLGAGHRGALVAGAIAGLGGAFAPGWVSLDSFAPAAVSGTVFFIAYARAARGDVRAGAVAGLCVGLLYLARAEGALFGVALLALRSRAGLAGAGVALAIGGAWQVRQLSLGYPTDVFARSALLLRYEDFFALAPAYGLDLASRAGALATNAVTFLFAFLLLLVPGIALAWRRARAWVALAALVFLVESLAFPLHSTRGAYFHSLAALFPFGVALGVVGLSRWATRRAVIPALAGAAIVSIFAVAEWDAAFNSLYRSRVEALARVPAGPFLAADAAAWRWISGRTVLVAAPDARVVVACRYGARAIVNADLTVQAVVCP